MDPHPRPPPGARSLQTPLLGPPRHPTPAPTGVQTYTRPATGEAVGFRISSSHYYVTDHLKSVIGMFSGTGIWEGGYSYSPYGEERAAAADGPLALNSLRYIGGYQESKDLYKMGARYYDASLGRFTQYDPSGQESQPYAYAECYTSNAKDHNRLKCIGTIATSVLAVGTAILTRGRSLSSTSGLALGRATATGGFGLANIQKECAPDRSGNTPYTGEPTYSIYR